MQQVAQSQIRGLVVEVEVGAICNRLNPQVHDHRDDHEPLVVDTQLDGLWIDRGMVQSGQESRPPSLLRLKLEELGFPGPGWRGQGNALASYILRQMHGRGNEYRLIRIKKVCPVLPASSNAPMGNGSSVDSEAICGSPYGFIRETVPPQCHPKRKCPARPCRA